MCLWNGVTGVAGPPGVVFEGEPSLSYGIQHTSPSGAADTPGLACSGLKAPAECPGEDPDRGHLTFDSGVSSSIC